MEKILYTPGQIKGLQHVLNSYGIIGNTNIFRRIMILNYMRYYDKDLDIQEKRRISANYSAAYPDLDNITDKNGIKMRMEEVTNQCWCSYPSYDIFLYVAWKKLFSQLEIISMEKDGRVVLLSTIEIEKKGFDFLFITRNDDVASRFLNGQIVKVGSEDFKLFLELAYDIEEALKVGGDHKIKRLYQIQQSIRKGTLKGWELGLRGWQLSV